jgi:hypothetical protein
VPLDLVVGMVGRMTPAMSASVALGHAHGPMREYEKALIAAARRSAGVSHALIREREGTMESARYRGAK